MAFVFVGFLQLFSDIGFGPALIRQSALTEELVATCFWINLLLGGVLLGLSGAVAPLVGRTFRIDEVSSAFMALSLNFPLLSLSIVQQAILEREMNFKFLGLVDIYGTILSTVGCIIMALYGFGVWSLVGRVLIFSFVKTIALLTRVRLVSIFKFSLSSLKQIWSFSTFLFGFNLVNYASRNSDNLLVGEFLGAKQLAFYNLSYQIMLYPLTYITWIISRVMYPVLVRFQGDIPSFCNIYIRTSRFVSFITFPLMMGLIAVAPEFVPAFLGPRWLSVIPVIRIFAAVAIVQSVASLAGSIFQSLDRMRLMFVWNLFASFVTVLGFVVGLKWGIYGVALAYMVVTYLITFPGLVIPFRLIGMSLRRFVGELMRNLAISSTMMCLVLSLREMLLTISSLSIRLAIEVSVGCVSYVVLSLLLNRKQVKELAGILPQHLFNMIPDFLLTKLDLKSHAIL